MKLSEEAKAVLRLPEPYRRKAIRMLIDLDAKRAARAEAEKTPHEVKFGGEVFELPHKLPLESIDLMAEGKFREAFALIFDDVEVQRRFFSHRPDDGDLEQIMSLYATGPEPSASPASSLSTGNGLRPTGRRTTTGTSRKTATAPTISEPESS